MNKRRIIYNIALTAVVSSLAACSVEEPMTGTVEKPQTEVPSPTDETVQGELFVCFDPRVSDILDKAGVTRSGDTPATRSGVLSVDEILDLVEGYEIERVFPMDARTEEATRKAGLHLWYVVRFSDEHGVDEVAADLSKLGEVSRVQYNHALKRASTEKIKPLTPEMVRAVAERTASDTYFNDPHLNLQWHLVNNGDLGAVVPEAAGKFVKGSDVNVEPAWKKTTGNPSIIVAVLDEGVDINHPDLNASMWENDDEVYGSDDDNDGNGYAGDVYGYNFVEDRPQITVKDVFDTGHGSHVAGVIAATNDNGIGISSIAGGTKEKPGVRIMSCQIFSGAYSGTLLEEVRAIKYAADNGAVILQCSWGYTSGAANGYDWVPQFSTDEQWETYNVLEKAALDYFTHTAGSPDGVIDGGIAVFAGGNESAPAAGYPGAYPGFVSVAAVAADYTPAVYTNYGGGTTISAPGGDQDYYYEYGEEETMGALGCILSTIPHMKDDGFGTYGYMEGTSMACPHVSGVIALGLSYAADLRKHFTAEEFKELLYSSCTEFDNSLWDDTKYYYKYVVDLGQNHKKEMPLRDFKGNMGAGLVNAEALLNAIAEEGNGTPMTFPNIYVAQEGQVVVNPMMYFKNGENLTYTVSIEDENIATCKKYNADFEEGDKEYNADKENYIVFSGVAEGQTTAVITAGSITQSFVITVRASANGAGWL